MLTNSFDITIDHTFTVKSHFLWFKQKTEGVSEIVENKISKILFR